MADDAFCFHHLFSFLDAFQVADIETKTFISTIF